MNDPRTMAPQFPPAKLFIDNAYVDSSGGGCLTVINPATGAALCEAAAGTQADVERAVKSARAAFETGPWRTFNPSKRARVLRAFSELVWKNREALALLESLNNGKTYRDALKGDVGPGASTLMYWADAPQKILGEVLPVDGPFHTYTVKEPVGVVAAIVPWNYPTSLACWKLGPALGAGCTVVLKPSELTPLTALKLGELGAAAGLPPGVLNVIPGLGSTAGDALARHPDVDKVSFTGSVRRAAITPRFC